MYIYSRLFILYFLKLCIYCTASTMVGYQHYTFAKNIRSRGDTNNYRGVGLSAVGAKMVNKLLLNSIQPKLNQESWLNPLLRNNQNGFRPGRSTTAHILALRRLIEGVRRNNLKDPILIDFSKLLIVSIVTTFSEFLKPTEYQNG